MVGKVIWITGLSGAGKTTLAHNITKLVREKGKNVITLDGDILRTVFTGAEDSQSSHSKDSRLELAKKYARLCQIVSEQDCWVIIATISLFKEIHSWNRANISYYFEVFLDVDMNELRRRDSKGIYSAFEKGDAPRVVGLDLDFDRPEAPNWYETYNKNRSSEDVADDIVAALIDKGWL